MIKVLHIFGKMDRGGAEMRTLELMPLLKEKGVRLDFCTLASSERAGHLDQQIRELGGEVFRCPIRPGLLTFGRRFLKFLRGADYDIIHSHVHYASGYIVHLARRGGVRGRIVHFRNTTDGRALTWRRRLYKALMLRMANRNATAILAVCRGAMDFAWGPDWQSDPRTAVIYNGLDTSKYEHIACDRQGLIGELSLSPDCRIVISVAHIHRQKAHDVLLDAASAVVAKNPKVIFLLVGDGVLRLEMEQKAKELGLGDNVYFLGLRSDVPRLLKSSDCFVLQSRWEGLPGVVLEAVAASLPVVGTDLPGVREIAEHTDLVSIVPVEDSKALADRLLTVIEATTQEKSSRPFPKEFDLDNCAEKLFDVYSSQVRE